MVFFFLSFLMWDFSLAQHKRKKKSSLKRLVSAPVLGSPLNLETLSTVLHKVHHPHNQVCFLPESKIAFWQWASRKCKTGNPGLTNGCEIISGFKWTCEPVSPVPFYSVHSYRNTRRKSATSQSQFYVKAMPSRHSWNTQKDTEEKKTKIKPRLILY